MTAASLPLVTVSGFPGSGTTTLAERLGLLLGLPVVSTGAVFRQMAAAQGITLKDLGWRASRDPQIDRALDARMLATIAETGPCVAEGRLTGVLVPDADLRVWLHAPQPVRAVRVWARSGESSADMQGREEREFSRYFHNYHVEIDLPKNYDLCLDTARLGADTVASLAMSAISARLAARAVLPRFASPICPSRRTERSEKFRKRQRTASSGSI